MYTIKMISAIHLLYLIYIVCDAGLMHYESGFHVDIISGKALHLKVWLCP